MKMKALNDIEKDKLIVKSIIEDDFLILFSNLTTEFKDHLKYMKGVAQKWNLDYDSTKKYYKNEIKNVLNDKDKKEIIIFFDSLSDKVALSQEKNLLIYISTFLFRFLYNIYFMSDKTVNDTIKDLLSKEEYKDILLFDKSSVSCIKSITDEYNEKEIHLYLILISELFYYMISQKSTSDVFREMITHGITGCFLLEEDNLKNILLLTNKIKIEEFLNKFYI